MGTSQDATVENAPHVEPDWRGMFHKYTDIVGRAEGVDFLDESEWEPFEWDAIMALFDGA